MPSPDNTVSVVWGTCDMLKLPSFLNEGEARTATLASSRPNVHILSVVVSFPAKSVLGRNVREGVEYMIPITFRHEAFRPDHGNQRGTMVATQDLHPFCLPKHLVFLHFFYGKNRSNVISPT